MLTRISAMLPINPRGMWVGTFHGLANRMLRTHYREANLPQLFQILDTQDQQALLKRLLKSLNVDEERFPPATGAMVHRRQQGGGPARARGRSPRRVQPAHGGDLRRLRRAMPARGSGRFRRAAAALLRAAREERDAARALPGALPPRARGRVPGHEPAADGSSCWRALHHPVTVAPTLPGQDGSPASPSGRGEGNVIFAVGDDDQSIYAFRGASSANMHDLQRDFAVGPRDQAGAELPLPRPHPRRGQRADRPQPQTPREEPVDGGREGRAAARLRGCDGSRGSGVHRRRGEGAQGGGHCPRPARGALPLERTVASAGARALQRGDPVPGLRRPALLRAPGGEARARLPATHRERRRRRRVDAHHQFPGARHRQPLAGAAAGSRASARREPLERGAREGGRRRRKASDPGVSVTHHSSLVKGHSGLRRADRTDAQRHSRAAAAGSDRARDRGERIDRPLPVREGGRGPAGEPGGAGERRHDVRRRTRRAAGRRDGRHGRARRARPRFSPMPRSRRASTRRRPGRKRCSS